jgi:hypothetical protein
MINWWIERLWSKLSDIMYVGDPIDTFWDGDEDDD